MTLSHPLKSRAAAVLLLPLLSLSCAEPPGAPPPDEQSTTEQHLDGNDDGMVTGCGGLGCDTYYSRSLSASLWDTKAKGLKLAADPLGGCFPGGAFIDAITSLRLPSALTALCIIASGKIGQDLLFTLHRAAQGGECLKVSYLKDADFLGGLKILSVGTSNGAACDEAEREWQRRHAPPATFLTDTGLRGLFNPITPVRLHDSRSVASFAAGETRQIRVRGNGTPIVYSATAVQLNLTVTSPSGPGYLTVWQCDRARPEASNVNFDTQQTVANSATSAVSSDGTVCVYSSQWAHVIVDASGYWDGAGAGFVPVSPYRGFDSRPQYGPIPSGTVSLGSQVPAGASAVALNMTVTDIAQAGFASIYPGFTAWPGTSNVNFGPSQTVAAASSVGLNQGRVSFLVSSPTDVILDVFGYYASWSTTRFAPVMPARILDTRRWSYSSPLVANTIVSVPTRLSGAPGGTVEAVTVNVTAVEPTGPGYLSIYPCDRAGGLPSVSNLNFEGGEGAVPNLATVQVDGSDQTICIYTSTTTHVLVDIQGYFVH